MRLLHLLPIRLHLEHLWIVRNGHLRHILTSKSHFPPFHIYLANIQHCLLLAHTYRQRDMSCVQVVLNLLESITPSKSVLPQVYLHRLEVPLRHRKMRNEHYNGEDPLPNRRVNCGMHIKRRCGDITVGKMWVSIA